MEEACIRVLVRSGSSKRKKSDTVHMTRTFLDGRHYARCGEIGPELLAGIMSPMIPEEQYADIVKAGA